MSAIVPIEKKEEKSIDKAAQRMIKRAEELEIAIIHHRFDAMQPQCEAGLRGMCCHFCIAGPCKLDPAIGVTRSICGASPEIMVARSLLRNIAGGCAAHADHAFEVVHTLSLLGSGFPYSIKDRDKLISVAKRLGIDIEKKTDIDIAREIGKKAVGDYAPETEEVSFLKAYIGKRGYELLKKLGVYPRSIWREESEALHRTTMGVDLDPVNILLHGLRTALADCDAQFIATELQDILFGTPKPLESVANIGVLSASQINIAVHGHNPLLSVKVVEAARSEEIISMAKSVGAEGINVVGICCTGNEVFGRYGIPLAANSLNQELALATGSLEAMIVDYQCIFPGTMDVAKCFHTKLITTMPIAKIPGALHIEWSPEKADEVAEEVATTAINNFKNRDPGKVSIPDVKSKCMGGFSVEAIVSALGGTLEPLIKAIKDGNIYGIVGVVGCNNPNTTQDSGHVILTKELISNDVLVVNTGCSGIAMAKHGLATLEAQEIAGKKLAKILTALKIPPALHMGSCVDNSRIVNAIFAMANALGVDASDLPVFGSAPEAMTEKALAIGTYFVANGISVHLGVVPPVLGSDTVTKFLTDEIEKYLGAKFVVEPNPKKASEIILEHIAKKRKKLGLSS